MSVRSLGPSVWNRFIFAALHLNLANGNGRRCHIQDESITVLGRCTDGNGIGTEGCFLATRRARQRRRVRHRHPDATGLHRTQRVPTGNTIMVRSLSAHPTNTDFLGLLDCQIHAKVTDDGTEPIVPIDPGCGRRFVQYRRYGRTVARVLVQIVDVHLEPVHAVAKVAPIVRLGQQIRLLLCVRQRCLGFNQAIDHESSRLF
uniref:Putative secreted protein n=1 Tax=Anopheles darlingi TaxID=43151 RepID=A0A2M4DB06_ANODA